MSISTAARPVVLVVAGIFLANVLVVGRYVWAVRAETTSPIGESPPTPGPAVLPLAQNSAGPEVKDPPSDGSNGSPPDVGKGPSATEVTIPGSGPSAPLPPIPSPVPRVPAEKRAGDLLVLLVETDELRKDGEAFQAVVSALKDFRAREVPKLKRELLGGKVYVTRRTRNEPWDGGAAPVPAGEAFERAEFEAAFQTAFKDVEELTAQAEKPESVRAVLLWYSNFNPDNLGRPVTLRRPGPVLGLAWLDYREKSDGMNKLFDGRITPVSRDALGRLSESLTFVLQGWLDPR